MKTIGYLIYITHLYTLFSNLIKNFENNDLHVLRLLNNVKSEPKLSSFLFLDYCRIVFA